MFIFSILSIKIYILLLYMDHLKDLMLKKNRHQLILTILFILYLFFNVNVPHNLASTIDSPVGMIIVIVISIALLCITNPVLGFLGFIVAYELIRRSGAQTGSQAIKQNIITESKKYNEMESYNNDLNNNKLFSTLEEVVVSNMVPYINNTQYDNSNVKPVLDKQHDAASVHYKGVV